MAGAGAEAKIRETNFKKVEPEINNFGSATLIGTVFNLVRTTFCKPMYTVR